MDIAVLADIHGNYIALNECISHAKERGIRSFIFLGDYLGELAYPERTMRMLYDLKEQYECWFIRGNKEDYWLNHTEEDIKTGLWKEFDSTTGSLFYTYSHLTERDLKFYHELSISRQLSFSGLPEISICHGSPYKTNENLFPDHNRTFEIMEQTDTPFILCGHTHRQGKITHNGKAVLNAGSVGVPLDSNGKAQYMILHGEQGMWKEEFISLSYDVEKVIRELHEAGLDKYAPWWCFVTENLLRKGNISHAQVLSRAMKFCEEEYGECRWPEVPEKCWEQAAKEMIGEEYENKDN